VALCFVGMMPARGASIINKDRLSLLSAAFLTARRAGDNRQDAACAGRFVRTSRTVIEPESIHHVLKGVARHAVVAPGDLLRSDIGYWHFAQEATSCIWVACLENETAPHVRTVH